MSFIIEFPTIDTETLRSIKKSIDAGFKAFSRTYGDNIESLFNPVRFFLIESESPYVNTVFTPFANTRPSHFVYGIP